MLSGTHCLCGDFMTYLEGWMWMNKSVSTHPILGPARSISVSACIPVALSPVASGALRMC